MSDCPNVEMREALPELMHGRLNAADAARVREHVASCAECAAELELLERVRRAYTVAPAVDTAAIVRALPAPQVRRVVSSGILRLAAAIVLILAGTLVMRVVTSGPDSVLDTTGIVAGPDSVSPSVLPESARRSSGPRVLAMSLGELDDLDVDELQSLLGALEQIEAAPSAEPDTLIGSVGSVGS